MKKSILKIGISLVLMALAVGCRKNESDQEKSAAPPRTPARISPSLPVEVARGNKFDEFMTKGATEAKAGNHVEAMAYFDKAISLQPDNPQAWFNRGVSCLRLRKNSEAKESLRKVIFLHPENPFAPDRMESHRSLMRLQLENIRIYGTKMIPSYDQNLTENGRMFYYLLDPDQESTLAFLSCSDYHWDKGCLTCSVKDILREDEYTETSDVMGRVISRYWRNARIDFVWNGQPWVADAATAYLNELKIATARFKSGYKHDDSIFFQIQENQFAPSSGVVVYEGISTFQIDSNEFVNTSTRTPYKTLLSTKSDIRKVAAKIDEKTHTGKKTYEVFASWPYGAPYER